METNAAMGRELPATREYMLLIFALCHVYLFHGITTFHSDEIWDAAVRAQEECGLLLPIFREHRDKFEKRPYIEKHQPFLYRSLPGKNIFLYYRVDEDTHFHAKQMTYLRFGLYLAHIPVFSGEKVTYYFSEEMPAGSITTREKTVDCDTVYLNEKEGEHDPYFAVNNALIYERMFKYEQVERIITGLVKDIRPIRSTLL